ncbi:MAG: serine/threonine protein kinase [Casimicrobiaceae bacterium]|nr:serine/threonine protein kinase [Casimicrobiaceae bacterium]
MVTASTPGRDSPEVAAASEVLPAGTRVGGYRIDGVLGRGGFGIVYYASRIATGEPVALKEFFPATVAARRGSRIVPRRAEFHAALTKGVEGFLREARLLNELSHPALVTVHEAWLESGTAYMAMTRYEGNTLRRLRESLSAPPTQAQLRAWFEPVMHALLELHARRVIHRDVSPDNVFICRDGGAVLLDLGAARQILGGMTQALTMVLKPGFAPIEQYVDDGSLAQGRWTDVYGLAATLFFAVSGEAPVTATSRIVRDTQPDLATLPAARHLSPTFCAGIMRGLAPRAIDRPKSVPEFKTLLGWTDATTAMARSLFEQSAAPPNQAAPLEPQQVSRARVQADSSNRPRAARLWVSVIVLLIVLVGLLFAWHLR